MGTYISFPRTYGIQLRLSLLLIAILHLTLTKASLLPVVISGQAEVGWDRTIGDSKRPSSLGGDAATILSNKPLAWLGSSSNSGEQQQQHGGTMSAAAAVAGRGSAPALHRPRHPYSGGIGTTRVYNVYNRCSGGFVRLLDDGVDAAEGGPADDAARLAFETAENNLVRIRREHSNIYLCFNNKGKLVTETEPTELCLFNDTLTESHHTELQLAASSAALAAAAGGSGADWLVGFKKGGKPWRGYDYKRGRDRRCFQFTKRKTVLPSDGARLGGWPAAAAASSSGGEHGQRHSRPHGWPASAAAAAASDT